MSGRHRWDRDESLARRIALAPLLPLAWLYGAGAWLHRTLYRLGWRRAVRLGCRVVSVGNIAVGGAGKTPSAAWIAGELHRRGTKVVLASRGYGGQNRQPVLTVSDGRVVYATAAEAGDEPLLLAADVPGVPVLVGRDRSVVGLRAVSAFGAQVLVLDDGFQHHRLARDVDIVLVDAAVGFGNRQLLPRGPLRESTRVLACADAIGVIGGSLPADDDALLAERAPEAYRFRAERVPEGVRPLRGGPARPVSTLEGCEVGLLAGIARPASLRRTLEKIGARVVAERTFPDHHRYRASDFQGLEREAANWITTEKDAVKILPAWADQIELDVLAIQLRVEAGEQFLDWLEERLQCHR